MDATVVLPSMSYFQASPTTHHHLRISMQNRQRQRYSSSIVSVLSSDNRNIELAMTSSPTDEVAYKDNWFELLAINHLSNSLQSASGLRSNKNGYDGLVEAAKRASERFTPTEQRQVVIETLVMAFPKPIMSLIKTLLPPSKFAREYFAVFTTIFFPWFVGPCEVKESEFEGRKEKNVVYIPKCRFLEGTNCVGMCTNLCKMPSQAFIKETLGMPFTMVPNFDDMSCQMIFGEEPPSQEDDPAFAQPCYKQCKAKYRHQNICTGE